MSEKKRVVAWCFFILVGLCLPSVIEAKVAYVNTRSAILIDMTDGKILYQKNPDSPIAPASITKILTLYIVQEAIEDGRLHLWDKVKVSQRAASAGGSRMSLKAGQEVPVEEIIKGIAVVSGNDASVAIAEHMSGSVEDFVRLMNRKAKQLWMTNSVFMTPNGLPAKGQVSTARDLATLSMAYLRRFPETLNIHSMKSYTFNSSTHHNANRLLGVCPGVDGLKTGFVCSSGYNISATAKRGDTRLLAVVLGAVNPGIRARETEKLLNLGFRMTSPDGAGTAIAAFDDAPPDSASPSVIRKQIRKDVSRKYSSVSSKSKSKSAQMATKTKSPKSEKLASEPKDKKTAHKGRPSAVVAKAGISETGTNRGPELKKKDQPIIVPAQVKQPPTVKIVNASSKTSKTSAAAKSAPASKTNANAATKVSSPKKSAETPKTSQKGKQKQACQSPAKKAEPSQKSRQDSKPNRG